MEREELAETVQQDLETRVQEGINAQGYRELVAVEAAQRSRLWPGRTYSGGW